MTITFSWHVVFPIIATIWYFVAVCKAFTGHLMDPLAIFYYGTPYLIFWLTYLLVLHW